MGLHGDIEETKQAWKKVSWPMKVIYGLMLFLSISSLASLAQTVADWKGFFLTGIEFYRSVLRDPIFAWFIEHTNAGFTEPSGDILTLLFMIAVPMIFVVRSASATLGRFGWIGHLVVWFFILVPILVFVTDGWGHMIFGAEGSARIDSTTYPIFSISYALMVYSAFTFRGRTPVAKTLAVGPPLVVLLLAAINKGLSM